MNENIVKFMNASFKEAASMVRVGFEQETQSWMGLTSSDIDEMCDSDGERYDYDLLHEMTNETFEDEDFIKRVDGGNLLCGELVDLKLEDKPVYKRLMSAAESFVIAMRATLGSSVMEIIDNLDDAVSCGWRWDTEEKFEKVKHESDMLSRAWDDFYHYIKEEYCLRDRSGSYEDIYDAVSNTARYWDSNLLTVHHDGSVDGPEIVTRGGLTVQQFLKAADTVFNNDMNVDEGCSFHIHISLPGVRHNYGQNLQLACLEFLLKRKKSIPASVIERFRSASDNDDMNYFSPQIQNDRYCFVAHRGRTWEFRCWGNIRTTYQAAKCLALTIQALQYAYRSVYVTKKLELGEAKDRDKYEFEAAYYNAITGTRTFEEDVKYVIGF